MKSSLSLVVFLILNLISNQIQAQNTEESPKGSMEIFTPQERDSIQFWFYDRATVMGLQGEQRDEFYGIVLHHTARMKNLDSPKKNLSDQEIQSKVQSILDEQHAQVKALVDDKQYTYYLETMQKIMSGVFERRGWSKVE